MPGFEWTASVDAPTGMGAGEIGYVQLVNTLHTSEDANGNHKFQLTSNGKYILDDGTGDALYGNPQNADRSTTISNGATASRSLNDSPRQPCLLYDKSITVNDSFALYLMYKPAGADSIWTTVGVLNWGWDAFGERYTGDDNHQHWRGSGHPQAGIKITGAEPHDLPTWSDSSNALKLRDLQPVP